LKSSITGLNEDTPLIITNLGRPNYQSVRALIIETTIRYTNIRITGEEGDQITYRVMLSSDQLISLCLSLPISHFVIYNQ
jgi:hypothetical protein